MYKSVNLGLQNQKHGYLKFYYLISVLQIQTDSILKLN